MDRFLSAIICFLLLSCETKNIDSKPQLSDTTKVLNQAISMGIDDGFMPSAGGLKGRSHFGDTVLLTSQVLPIDALLQIVSTEKFKVMPRKEICAALKQDENFEILPHYLNVAQFEKNDSGYYIQLQSISCGEFASGGALGIHFKKMKDTFLVTNMQGSSIN